MYRILVQLNSVKEWDVQLKKFVHNGVVCTHINDLKSLQKL